jgi:hypothetical protein
MWGESGRSIRAVMGFDVYGGPAGRAGIAKGRLYLRSRFRLRNHQFAINRTGVHRYGVDDTAQSGAWYTRVVAHRPKSEYKFIYYGDDRAALKSLLERLSAAHRR